MMHRWLLAACLCTATAAACGLNPQPLPPEDSLAGTDAGAPAAKDSGAMSDASVSDGRTPDASDASDAQDGDADASDSDASQDADTDGG